MDNKLGRAAYLTIGTTNVDTSMGLYEKLGFKRENEGSAPVRWTEICDGSLHIILVEGKDEYLGLTYVSDDIDSGIETLKAVGLRPVMTVGTEEAPRQVIAQIRPGVLVSINQSRPDVDYNYVSKTLMDIDFANLTPENFPNSQCGIFGELALNINQLDTEIAFWEKIGFSVGEKNTMPYPWAIVSDGLFIIGLHETDEFDQPALTYFDLNMDEKIKRLQETGVEFASIDNDNSGTINTPEGQRFFLFPLGQ